jgi:hypothetical protein
MKQTRKEAETSLIASDLDQLPKGKGKANQA